MGCEDQKERKTESTKILMEKKRKKAMIHHQNLQLGSSIFPRKNRLKLVVEKAHGVWIPKETYCQGFTGIEVPYFSTRDAMKT